MNTYQIMIDQDGHSQTEKDASFIGGRPAIPVDVEFPRCGLCQAQETFFLQIAFPATHKWHDLSLALFHCTSCPTKEYCIPPMLQPPLKGAPIPAGFLSDYQINVHILVFPTQDGGIRTDYQERIRFKRIDLIAADEAAGYVSKVGGRPNWLLEDESPGLYADSTPMLFLFQLGEGLVFDTLPEAPPQASPYTWPGEIPDPFYRLFNGNELYAFGTQDRDNPLVYLLTQRD